MSRPKQLHFKERPMGSGRGGARPGAGRPPKGRPGIVHHVRRDPHPGRYPAHVTLRVREDVPSLRRKPFVREFRRSLAKVLSRKDFRVIHYSIQRNHLHLIVEASGRDALAAGMKAVGARVARAANRLFDRRGPVLLGRYHLRRLRTPREVRNALAYVLLNARKHWKERRGMPPPVRLDQASSGAWFDGWSREPPGPRSPALRDVAHPRTWLLSTGWRRHGRIRPEEVPGNGARRRGAPRTPPAS